MQDPAGDLLDSPPRAQGLLTWAALEVLRHTGLRIEELLELTTSLRLLRKQNGEIVLLQVAPSKTDEERICR